MGREGQDGKGKIRGRGRDEERRMGNGIIKFSGEKVSLLTCMRI